MKKIFFVFAVIIFVSSISFSQELKSKLIFEKTTVDYGTIKKGSDPVRIVEFTNSSNEPILITTANASCGCTSPSYPSTPIPAGGKDKIEIKYDTNRVGSFKKVVSIITYDGAVQVLDIIGNVIE